MKQDITQSLETEYLRFIEFGQLLDRKSRQYLVQYLKSKLDDRIPVLATLKDQYFQYFTKALDDLFHIHEFLNILTDNELLTKQVVLDILFWIRKTYQEINTKNPFQTEMDKLGNWSITPLHVFVGRWQILTQTIKAFYPKEVLDIGFYENRFQTYIGDRPLEEINQQDRPQIDLLINDLLAQWDARLQAKLLDYQLQKFDQAKDAFLVLMEAKVAEYQKLKSLIAPFTEYLGWDLSRSLWQETSFDTLKKYHDYLENEDNLRQLADMLGKLREAEMEMEEETLEKTIIRQEWVSDPFLRAEITGIQKSNDLNLMLSSEASLLADHHTEDLFLKRFVDAQLLTFQYEDQKLVPSNTNTTEVFQKVKQKEKGPFMICMDSSESMTGEPEHLAKVLTLGILKMAVQEQRRAYLINFSAGIQTLDLYEISNSIDELATFLKMSFYGGTDINLPLYEIFKQLKSNDYQDADVLVVSDFIMYKIDQDVIKQVRYYQQNQGTQFHSLTLSPHANATIVDLFDTNWLYDPKQKDIVKDLNRHIQQFS